MDINRISAQVIDSAMRVHSQLGPGLLESAYEACLAHELQKRGVRAVRQLPMPIEYDGLQIDTGYRIDLLVEDTVIVGSRPSRRFIRSTAPNCCRIFV